ncbi:MAG: GerMN domain-containing protein, partial [Clostridia bacterium]|nr:GerMN domain-containing protein [Clostridia bacterium]
TYTIDLNSAFVDNRQAEAATNQLAIQSFVATLTEFTVIDQVKFNVNGQTSGVSFGDISLDQPIQLKPELLAE